MTDVKQQLDHLRELWEAERHLLEVRAKGIKVPTDYMEHLRFLEGEVQQLPDEFEQAVQGATRRSHKNAIQAAIKRTYRAIEAGRDIRPEWLALNDAWERCKDDYRLWEYSEDQSEKGKLGAQSRWGGDARDKLSAIYAHLASKRDALGDYIEPRDLWPVLFDELGKADLEPSDPEDGVYHYEGDNGTPITYGAFRQAIARQRRKN